jgi:predicted SAM-dependent methyltransferase
MTRLRINVGCGDTPTSGWINFDNSFSIIIAKLPLFLARLLLFFRVIIKVQYQYIVFIKDSSIRYGNILKGLPIHDNSIEVLYSSHMLEHFDSDEAEIFCQEAHRILIPGGIIRIVVPDLTLKVNEYSEHKDANLFIDSLNICIPKPKTFINKIYYGFFNSYRRHQRMYDHKSLEILLKRNRFVDIQSIESGDTMIADPGSLNLRENESESLYIEAKKAL